MKPSWFLSSHTWHICIAFLLSRSGAKSLKRSVTGASAPVQAILFLLLESAKWKINNSNHTLPNHITLFNHVGRVHDHGICHLGYVGPLNKPRISAYSSYIQHQIGNMGGARTLALCTRIIVHPSIIPWSFLSQEHYHWKHQHFSQYSSPSNRHCSLFILALVSFLEGKILEAHVKRKI